jgi:hypothetical protein
LGLGFIPPITAIVTTVLLVVLTDAKAGTKLAAVVVCVASFFIPEVVPALWWSPGPTQVILSIVIILYLKYKGYIG